MRLDSLHDWLVFNANYSFKISCLMKVTNVKHLHFYDIIQHFPFICSNIPAAPAYGVYISQLIRYSSACGSYQNFLDRELLLTRKLLNQEFLLVNLKSSLRKFYGRHHNLVERYGISVSQMITDMFHLSYTLPGTFLIHDLSPSL